MWKIIKTETDKTKLRTYVTLLKTNYIFALTALHTIGGNNTHIVSSS